MLIQLYILALVLSAITLVASLLLGGARAEGPYDSPDSPRTGSRSKGFWTFFVASFGIIGLLLDGLDLVSAGQAVAIALATAAVIAVIASRALAR
ncbi:MAG: hypothetical protein AAF436_08010 [Myxococcota bacterium]